MENFENHDIEKKDRQLDNLINLVENHTRTKRHLEQYSHIGNPENKENARKIQEIREEQINMYESNSRKDLADMYKEQNKYLKELLPPTISKEQIQEDGTIRCTGHNNVMTDLNENVSASSIALREFMLYSNLDKDIKNEELLLYIKSN